MKILIVDDHPMVRKGISAILSMEGNIDIIKEASNAEEAIECILKDKPEVAIVDLRLGKDDGLDVVMNANKEGVETKFIILTSSVQKEDFTRALACGVEGYILKEALAEDILYALHIVIRGKKYYHPDIVQYDEKQDGENELDQLTHREKDVLVELGNGKSNVEIADALFISEHTVKKHVSNILLKLQLSHRTQAALMARDVMNS